MATPDNRIQWPTPRALTFSSDRQALESRKADLKRDRDEFLEDAKEITEVIRTRAGRFVAGDNRRRRSTKVLHEGGVFASRTCGAGIFAGVSSPSRPWMRLRTPDSDLNEYHSVKRWLDQVEKRLYQVFQVSNYYHSKQSSYRDMADFGQGPVLIDEDYENVINCYCSPVGEYTLGVNQKGLVDTIYRDMRRTTKDIIETYLPFGRIPVEVRREYDQGRYDRMWDVVSVTQPNIRMIKGQRGPLGMPFMRVDYVLGVADTATDDSRNNSIVAVSGNWDNPISAARWDVQPGDIYAFDYPGVIALGGAKSLQVLERRKGQMIDKAATPVMQGPVAMKNAREQLSHMPGAFNWFPDNMQPGSNGAIMPAYRIDPAALDAVRGEEMTLETRVDRAYYVDLFLAVIRNDRSGTTATEINEVHEEKLISLSPMLERTHYEGLNVDIKRTVGILARNRVLPPPPPELDGLPLKVEYTSILATAMRAQGALGVERFAGFLGNLAAASPDILDKIDMDQTADEYADMMGVPASIVRSDDEVKKLREGRRAQEQALQAQAAAAQTAQTAQVLSQADTGRNSNLLADIIGNQGRIV